MARVVMQTNALWNELSVLFAGIEAPLLYSVHYAPPEVIAAAVRKDTSIVANGAVDIWALGVIAFGACAVSVWVQMSL